LLREQQTRKPRQTLVATIICLYRGEPDKTWLARLPSTWHAADAVAALLEAGAMRDWGRLVALYPGGDAMPKVKNPREDQMLRSPAPARWAFWRRRTARCGGDEPEADQGRRCLAARRRNWTDSCNSLAEGPKFDAWRVNAAGGGLWRGAKASGRGPANMDRTARW